MAFKKLEMMNKSYAPNYPTNTKHQGAPRKQGTSKYVTLTKAGIQQTTQTQARPTLSGGHTTNKYVMNSLHWP